MVGRRGDGALLVAIGLAAGCGYSAQARTAGWSMAQTEHIRLYTDIGAERAAELVVELQRRRDILASSVLRCAFEDKADQIVVTVLPADEYRDIARRNTAGHYHRWPVTWVPDFAGQIVMPDRLDRVTLQVYQHELTHHLVAACFPSTPRWLDEGMAGLLETVVVDGDKVLIGVPPFAPLKSVRRPQMALYRGVRVLLLPIEGLPSIAQVTAMSARRFFGREEHEALEVARYYATSWALVHLLELDAADLRPRFARFLGGLRRHDADPTALFAEAFRGVDLQRRLDDYLRRGDMSYLTVRPPPQRKIGVRVRAMTPAEAHLQWAWLWFAAPASEARERMSLHLDAARAAEESGVRARAYILAAGTFAARRDLVRAEREISAGLRALPANPELLHAELELLFQLRRDPSAIARRLRSVARTGEQICALVPVELMRGETAAAIALAMRGLELRPGSQRCRAYLEVAREAVRARRSAAPPSSSPTP